MKHIGSTLYPGNLSAMGITLCFLIILHISSALKATEKPLWELGFGVAALSLPEYRGSDRQQLLGLPLPYIIYRGDVIKVDRAGVRGQLLDSGRWKLELSLNANPPAESDDNPRREGMPDLLPTIELGPKLNVLLKEWDNSVKLQFQMPVRGVLGLDLDDSRFVGWLLHPHINVSAPAIKQGWNLGLKVGPLFADHAYHDYFYGVSPGDVMVDRPAFDVGGGYNGSMLLFSISKRFENYWVGGFLRYDNLAGAAFADSPLLATEHVLMAGFAAAWILKKSTINIQANH